MKKLIETLKTTCVILLFFFSTEVQAQPEMADTMRSNGKIYVVVGVVGIIFIGIIIYLIIQELRIRKIEKELDL